MLLQFALWIKVIASESKYNTNSANKLVPVIATNHTGQVVKPFVRRKLELIILNGVGLKFPPK